VCLCFQYSEYGQCVGVRIPFICGGYYLPCKDTYIYTYLRTLHHVFIAVCTQQSLLVMIGIADDEALELLSLFSARTNLPSEVSCVFVYFHMHMRLLCVLNTAL
jgi:hypothetical protein